MPDVSSGGLPRPLTSFIGRERELALARRLLAGSYLVTLTGPGGSGKTRLCIALAADVAGDYPDGVYFVPLAPVRDPGLVPSTIAQSIGLQDARDRTLTSSQPTAPGRSCWSGRTATWRRGAGPAV
jgi:predicted ATPase